MNKLIVVTGGTKGIGKSIIQKFASEGFDIVTCARNSDNFSTLNDEFSIKYSDSSLVTIQADLSKKDQTKNFIDQVLQLNRPVEVLVNNTGPYIPGAILEEEEGILESMIETNLYSAYRVSRGLIPGMKEKKQGHVFMICSTASIMPYENGGSYCIAKFGMLGMTKVLRKELYSSGVKVTAILPGATYTASWEGVDIPEDRFMKPEDVALAIYNAYEMSSRTVVEEILIRPQLGDL